MLNPSGKVNVNEVQDEATESDLVSEERAMKKSRAAVRRRRCVKADDCLIHTE